MKKPNIGYENKEFRAFNTTRLLPDKGEDPVLAEMVYFNITELDGTYIIPSGTYLEGDYSIMQLTGMKDKNGKMIWQGDIVKGKFGKAEVYGTVMLHNGTFYVGYIKEDSHGLTALHSVEDCEKIGNVFSNPKLLKK